ncbi:MAG: septal ring lytic transglycosylase RlpA family protein [Cytophagales bacterium]|nr:septal ring lytic transglycosylase RlpA family protein [Cytophagales bacterium]
MNATHLVKFFLVFIFSGIAPQLQAQKKSPYTEHGVASFYHKKFEGRKTSNGEKFSNTAMTAAHLSLPFNTRVRVTNKANNRQIVVRINDRGPFVKGRHIDLSRAAANKLGFVQDGVANVLIEVVSYPDENGKQRLPAAAQKKPAREFFTLRTIAEQPDGFSVQIGSFRELDNIIRNTQAIQEAYNCKVIMEPAQVNGQKYYRVSLGAFPSRSEAEELRDEIKGTFADCFVIDLRIKKIGN